MDICNECHANVEGEKIHTYDHCLIAKAYPDNWKEIIKRLQSNNGGK